MKDVFNDVWEALYDDPTEIAVNRAKAVLMDKIKTYIKENKLTQKQAAKKMCVSQPRVSDINNGTISKFTIDALIGMLAQVDVEAKITFPNTNFEIAANKMKKWPKLVLLPSRGKKRNRRPVDFETTIVRQGRYNGVNDEYAHQA